MWIICDAGFFNIICQDDDDEKGLLTVKARSREDLQEFQIWFGIGWPEIEIEESPITDYRFRLKAPRFLVKDVIKRMTDKIDYPKTKPKLAERHPERGEIYLNVWGDLLRIQHESKA